jgi:hypothetical protein
MARRAIRLFGCGNYGVLSLMHFSTSSTVSYVALQFSSTAGSGAAAASSSAGSSLLEQAVIMDKAITIRAVIRKEESLLRSVKAFISYSLGLNGNQANHKKRGNETDICQEIRGCIRKYMNLIKEPTGSSSQLYANGKF